MRDTKRKELRSMSGVHPQGKLTQGGGEVNTNREEQKRYKGKGEWDWIPAVILILMFLYAAGHSQEQKARLPFVTAHTFYTAD